MVEFVVAPCFALLRRNSELFTSLHIKNKRCRVGNYYFEVHSVSHTAVVVFRVIVSSDLTHSMHASEKIRSAYVNYYNNPNTNPNTSIPNPILKSV